MVNSIKKNLSGILVAGVSLGLTGCGEDNAYTFHGVKYELYTEGHNGSSPIYKKEVLEDSSINPRQLAFIVGDFDANGKKEVTLCYEGKKYLMRTNSAGDVYLQKFELVLPQIKPVD